VALVDEHVPGLGLEAPDAELIFLALPHCKHVSPQQLAFLRQVALHNATQPPLAGAVQPPVTTTTRSSSEFAGVRWLA